MAKVSLIIPTFNRPHLLPRCVESALRSGQDVEIVVVDDASFDRTASVCESLSGIKYVRLDRNQGVAGARNVGLLASTGDYIAFLDDDDLRLPGSLTHQLALLEASTDAGFVAGAVLLADGDCVPTGEVAVPRAQSGDLFWQVIELSLHLIPASVLVRRECFFEVGIFDQSIAGVDDWDMWTRIAEVRPIVIDDRPVCIYRCATPESRQGSSYQASHLYAAVKHQARLLSLPRARPASPRLRRSIRRSIRRRVADTLSRRAAEELPRGAFRFAAANFFTALRISPLRAARPTHLRILWRSAIALLKGRRSLPSAAHD
jgi:glycosyltransferase involved in cell wall biosynthesis